MITFLLAFGFSFIGSIPPGAINISVIQYAIEGKIREAARFSIASALVEFPYALIAIFFSELLLSTDVVINNLKIISTSLIIVLAIINTYSYFSPSKKVPAASPPKPIWIILFNSAICKPYLAI